MATTMCSGCGQRISGQPGETVYALVRAADGVTVRKQRRATYCRACSAQRRAADRDMGRPAETPRLGSDRGMRL